MYGARAHSQLSFAARGGRPARLSHYCALSAPTVHESLASGLAAMLSLLLRMSDNNVTIHIVYIFTFRSEVSATSLGLKASSSYVATSNEFAARGERSAHLLNSRNIHSISWLTVKKCNEADII